MQGLSSVTIDKVSALLQGLNVKDAASTQSAIMERYNALKDRCDAQDRATTADYAGEHDEEAKACKQACLLFVARVLAQQDKDAGPPQNMGLPISRIISVYGVNMLDFFRELHVTASKLSPYFDERQSSLKNFSELAQLKENSETVVVMGLLAKKYKENFNTFLHQLDNYKPIVMRLGWNAFLVLKVKLLSTFPDVVSCVELLPCIFAILANHAPRLPDCLMHIPREARRENLLKSISELCKADYGRVRSRMPAVVALLSQVLTGAVPEWRDALAEARMRAADAAAAAGLPEAALGGGGTVDLISAPVLDGLVTDNERMLHALAALEHMYEQHLLAGGPGAELDERDFLSTDFARFASPRFSPAAMHAAATKLRAGSSGAGGMNGGGPGGMGAIGGLGQLRSGGGGLLGPGAHTTASPHHAMAGGIGAQLPVSMMVGLAPGLHSPLPQLLPLGAVPGSAGVPVGGVVLPGTPVSEVMGAAAWLRGVTGNLASEPTAVLLRFLAAMPVTASSAPPAPGGLLANTAAASQPGAAAAVAMSKRVREMVVAVIPEDNAPSLLGPFPLLGPGPSLSAERRAEAVKLYYHSLESILVAEERQCGASGVTALLLSAKFHRGLVACCCEVVAACYRMVSCAFPKVLDALKIKAYDLGKMIPSFVRSVATLPRELKRHLFLVEEKIVESLAWEPNSTLYHLIRTVHVDAEAATAGAVAAAAAVSVVHAEAPSASRDEVQPQHSCAREGSGEADPGGTGAGTGVCNAQALTGPDGYAAPMDSAARPGQLVAGAGAGSITPCARPPSPKRPQGSAFFGGMMMSPAKKARGAGSFAQPTLATSEELPLCIGRPPCTAGGGSEGLQLVGAAAHVHEFCRKVLKLADFRLALLCENFDFSPLDRHEVHARVFATIEHALYEQTHLFYNRHIDQIMLSALYGYCKVHKLQQVSFREIIAHYRKQPQAQQAIFRSVVIEQTNPDLQVTSRLDIIAFYNQVFVPAMKSFLLRSDNGHVSGTAGHGADGLTPSSAPSGPGGRSQAKHGSGITVSGAMTGSAGASGMGLPPLPPRTAGHSPRAQPRLPPLSTRGPARGDAEPREYSGHGAASPSGPMSPGRGGRGRGTATLKEHHIPEGLAALLQALDSQQQGSGDEEDEEGMAHAAEEEDALRGEGLASGASSRSVRAGRGTARRGRGSVAVDAMDAEGPGVAADAHGTGGTALGRRQRTPNRRYGND